jgi:hypothetical protein
MVVEPLALDDGDVGSPAKAPEQSLPSRQTADGSPLMARLG